MGGVIETVGAAVATAAVAVAVGVVGCFLRVVGVGGPATVIVRFFFCPLVCEVP
jgi:hypothetical protein